MNWKIEETIERIFTRVKKTELEMLTLLLYLKNYLIQKLNLINKNPTLIFKTNL